MTSKGEIIISEIRGEAIEVKVDQVFHVIKDNRMARRNELKCLKVIVKPIVTSMKRWVCFLILIYGGL